jgi:hypothetical protein
MRRIISDVGLPRRVRVRSRVCFLYYPSPEKGRAGRSRISPTSAIHKCPNLGTPKFGAQRGGGVIGMLAKRPPPDGLPKSDVSDFGRTQMCRTRVNPSSVLRVGGIEALLHRPRMGDAEAEEVGFRSCPLFMRQQTLSIFPVVHSEACRRNGVGMRDRRSHVRRTPLATRSHRSERRHARDQSTARRRV